MTLDPKDLDELKKLSSELGMNFTDIVDQLNKGTISLEQFKTYMTGLRAQAKIYNTELDYTVSSYAQILNQLGKQNQGLKLANSSISSLSDIARKGTAAEVFIKISRQQNDIELIISCDGQELGVEDRESRICSLNIESKALQLGGCSKISFQGKDVKLITTLIPFEFQDYPL